MTEHIDWGAIVMIAVIVMAGSCAAIECHHRHAARRDCIKAGFEVVNGDCVRGKP